MFSPERYGLFLEVEIRDILEVQRVKSNGGETERAKCEVLEVRQ